MSKLLSGFCLAGTDKTPYSIDSLKFSTLQLICLGFWDKSDNTFLEIAPDQESHPVFVVFDEKVIIVTLECNALSTIILGERKRC